MAGQPQYVTIEQLEAFRQEVFQQHEQTRKLMNNQAIAIDRKLTAMQDQISSFLGRRPDPALIKDVWIRQIPKVREELKALSNTVARMQSKIPTGAV